MLNKRGQEELLKELFFELVIGGLIGVALIEFAHLIVNPITIEKEYLSRDLGLTTGFIQQLPLPIMLKYTPLTKDFTKYYVSWKDNIVSAAYGKSDGSPKNYYFLRNLALFKGNYDIAESPEVYFLNSRNKLEITKSADSSYNFETQCSYADFTYNTIFIDPGHGENVDTGYTFDSNPNAAEKKFRESEYTCKLANAVSSKMNEKTILSSRTVDSAGAVSCEGSQLSDMDFADNLKKSDLIISFHVGFYSSDKNIVKAYIPKNSGFEKAQSVACRILNGLAKQGADTAIIPVDIKNYDLTKKYPMLIMPNPTIVFEFGSLSSSITRSMLTDKATSDTIAEVLNG